MKDSNNHKGSPENKSYPEAYGISQKTTAKRTDNPPTDQVLRVQVKVGEEEACCGFAEADCPLSLAAGNKKGLQPFFVLSFVATKTI